MKSWISKRTVISIAALSLCVAMLAVGGSVAAQSDSDSGVPGLEGPTFTFGIVRLASFGTGEPPSGAAAEVWNCAPYAFTGYALSKNPGSLHVWISSLSQAMMDLGYKPGDIVIVLCSESQIESINVGDWIQLSGFTVRGQFVRANDIVLPAPFGY
jgi:hypothetical protein